MAFSSGKNTDIRLDNSAGSLTDISAYCKDVSFKRNGKTIDVSTYGNDWEAFIGALKGADLSIEGVFDAAADAVLAAALSTQRSFQYGPQGVTVGNVKLTGECLGESYETKTPVDGAVTFSASLKITGAVTSGTY